MRTKIHVPSGILRIKPLMKALGNPEKKFPCVHVTGSNGKGSVCAMIESICRSAGYKTGLFTSPHLAFEGECFQINRQIMESSKLEDYKIDVIETAKTLSKEDSERLIKNDLDATVAISYFADEKVDLGILECYAGGHFDGTNIVTPEVSVITSISLEHTEYFGNSLKDIAKEKSGIIKSGIPVVLGWLPKEAEDWINWEAKEKQSPVFSVRKIFGENLENYPKTSLRGSFQRINSAVAMVVCKILSGNMNFRENFHDFDRNFDIFDQNQEKIVKKDYKFDSKFPKISDYFIESGLKSVFWQGRWQEFNLPGNRKIIFDATHTPEGINGLIENIKTLNKKPIIILGSERDYRIKEIVPKLAPFAKLLILSGADRYDSVDFETMLSFVPEDFKEIAKKGSLSEMFPIFKHCTFLEKENETVLVSGSYYLVGKSMKNFLGSVENFKKVENFI